MVDRLEAETLVQRDRRVVGFDAQAQPRVTAASRLSDESREQRGADAPAPRRRTHADRHLRGGAVDEAVTGIVRGEEPAPGGADGTLHLPDEPEVAPAGPAGDVVGERRFAHDLGDRSSGGAGSPVRGDREHLPEEGRVLGCRSTNAGRRRRPAHRSSVTTTLPTLWPPSTRRCASTISANGTTESITGFSTPSSASDMRVP